MLEFKAEILKRLREALASDEPIDSTTIAAELGCSPATVRVVKHQARKGRRYGNRPACFADPVIEARIAAIRKVKRMLEFAKEDTDLTDEELDCVLPERSPDVDPVAQAR